MNINGRENSAGLSEENTGSTEIERNFKFSRWAVFIIVILAAALTVLYVYNVTRIDKLLEEKRMLSVKLHKAQSLNDIHTAEIIRLQSAGRITNIAAEKLNMHRSESPPGILP